MAPKQTARGAEAPGRTAMPLLGTRDELWPDSTDRRELITRILSVFSSHGYDLVVTPPIEPLSVLARGGGLRDDSDLLRFVEPESGEVAAFRPDITPQIARVVATRLRERPMPMRLAYEGLVWRKRLGRARTGRQVMQAGVELVGASEPDGDLEVIALAARACAAVGLRQMRVELSHSHFVNDALSGVLASVRSDARLALARKDRAALHAILTSSRAPRDTHEKFEALLGHGASIRTYLRVASVFRGAAARRALGTLGKIARAVERSTPGVELGVDLSEARDTDYYTGASFALLAPGPGEPLGAGGRYDTLLERFGLPARATGFALDVDHVAWAAAHGALRRSTAPRRAVRVLVAGPAAKTAEICARLRDHGMAAASLPPGPARALAAHALAWSYDVCVTCRGSGVTLVPVERETSDRVADTVLRALRPTREKR